MNASVINEWLDEYNDYMRLHQMFGDQAYLDIAMAALDHLQTMTNRIKQHQNLIHRLMEKMTNMN